MQPAVATCRSAGIGSGRLVRPLSRKIPTSAPASLALAPIVMQTSLFSLVSLLCRFPLSVPWPSSSTRRRRCCSSLPGLLSHTAASLPLCNPPATPVSSASRAAGVGSSRRACRFAARTLARHRHYVPVAVLARRQCRCTRPFALVDRISLYALIVAAPRLHSPWAPPRRAHSPLLFLFGLVTFLLLRRPRLTGQAPMTLPYRCSDCPTHRPPQRARPQYGPLPRLASRSGIASTLKSYKHNHPFAVILADPIVESRALRDLGWSDTPMCQLRDTLTH